MTGTAQAIDLLAERACVSFGWFKLVSSILNSKSNI